MEVEDEVWVEVVASTLAGAPWSPSPRRTRSGGSTRTAGAPMRTSGTIIAARETPFSMLQDLWINYPDRFFRPIHYSSPDALTASLNEKIIRRAEARFVELVRRKGETMGGEHV